MLPCVKKKLVLGNEYDDALRQAVLDCLAAMGADIAARQFGFGGSQIIETMKVTLGKDLLLLEAETYVGLSVSGEARIVDRLASMVAERTSRA